MNAVLLNIIFQGWPEEVALIFTALAVLGVTSPLKKIVWYGLILTLVIWSIRILSIPFGMHLLATILGLALIVYKETKVSVGVSFFATFIATFLLISSETLVHLVIQKLFGNIGMPQGWSWVIAGWPQILMMIGWGLIIKKFIRPFVLSK